MHIIIVLLLLLLLFLLLLFSVTINIIIIIIIIISSIWVPKIGHILVIVVILLQTAGPSRHATWSEGGFEEKRWDNFNLPMFLVSSKFLFIKFYIIQYRSLLDLWRSYSNSVATVFV